LTWVVISRASDGPDGANAPTLRGARSHARKKVRVSLTASRLPGVMVTQQADVQAHKLTDKAEHNVFMGWSMAAAAHIA
jgi:hypothetical protein